LDLELALLFKIGAVFALLVAFLYGLRRMVGQAAPRARGLIHILETKAMPQSHTLYLVRVGQQSFLLGGSKESLSLLTEVDGLPLPAEQEGQPVRHLTSGDWRKAPSMWLSWCRDRFHLDDRRSSGANLVDRA